MLLKDKIAVIYGAGGKVGGAVARAMASDGARVFLAGRTLEKVRALTDEIVASGGVAEAAQVDVLDKAAVEAHLAAVMQTSGRLDISINAMSIRGDLQGVPLLEMTAENFLTPPSVAITGNFITATAAGRHMVKAGSGVILTISTSAAGLSGRDQVYHAVGGFGVACSAVEGFSRALAAEVGPKGVRVVCLRPDALPETWSTQFEGLADSPMVFMTNGTVLRRLPKLREVADAAVFAASDRASAMTGTIMNLTCGSVLDKD